MVYLDNNATTQPDPQVVAAVASMLTDHWHNPSSIHRPGQTARQQIELARRSIADLVHASPHAITFTSGGTEAIDLALRGAIEASGRRVIVTTSVEHAAIRDLASTLSKLPPALSIEVRIAPVDCFGVVSVDALERLIDPSVSVVSIQWANNETGVIQPVQQIAKLCRDRNVAFHCDATQWIGKLSANLTPDSTTFSEDPAALDADFVTFAPHKFHGPKGVGVLVAKRGARFVPRLRGSQEKGRRGGTENAPGIAGAGVAADLASAWLAIPAEQARLAALRDRFEQSILSAIPDARINGRFPYTPSGPPPPRLWNTTNIAFPRLEAEALLLLLSEQGVCASAGAACSSGSLDPSPVLLAMGVPPDYAHGSIRFSLSRHTTDAEIDEALPIITRCVNRLRGSSSAAIGT